LKTLYGRIINSVPSFSDEEKKTWLLKKIGVNESFESMQCKLYNIFGRDEEADFSLLGPYKFNAKSFSDDLNQLHETEQLRGDIKKHETTVVVQHWTSRIRDTIADKLAKFRSRSNKKVKTEGQKWLIETLGASPDGKILFAALRSILGDEEICNFDNLGPYNGDAELFCEDLLQLFEKHPDPEIGTVIEQWHEDIHNSINYLRNKSKGEDSGTSKGEDSGTGKGEGSGTGEDETYTAAGKDEDSGSTYHGRAYAGSDVPSRQKFITDRIGTIPNSEILNEELHKIFSYKDILEFDDLGPYTGDPDLFCDDLLLLYEGNRETDWLLKQWCAKIKDSIKHEKPKDSIEHEKTKDSPSNNYSKVLSACSTTCLGKCLSATDGGCMFLSNALMGPIADHWSENRRKDLIVFQRNQDVIITSDTDVFVPLAIDRNLERNFQSRTQWVNTSNSEWIYWSKVGFDAMTWDKGENIKRLFVGHFYKAKESPFGKGLRMILKILRGKCKDSKIALLVAYYVPEVGWVVRYEKASDSHIDWLKKNEATEHFAPAELVISLLKSYHVQSSAIYLGFDKMGGFDEDNPRYVSFRNGREVSLDDLQVEELLEISFPEDEKPLRGGGLHPDDISRVCVLPPFEYMSTQCQQHLRHQKHNQALNIDPAEGKYIYLLSYVEQELISFNLYLFFFPHF